MCRTVKKKLTILHVTESSETGGAETVILNIVNHLDKREFHSEVVVMQPGWLKDRLKDSGCEPVLLQSDKSYDFGFLLKLRSVIKDLKIDLIHAHLPGSNAYSCLAGAAAGVPVVATYHGMLTLSERLSRSEKVQLFLVRKLARRIVTVSDHLKDELRKMAKIPSGKLVTVYNGVNWEPYDTPFDAAKMKQNLGLEPDSAVIGMVANLKSFKGYEYFVRAAAVVAREVPRAVFLIAGDGEESVKAGIKAEIAKHGLQEKVLFLGYRENIANVVRVLDVSVLSSISEGMSIVTVEAMGAGVPVVVTRSGGPEELVDEGRTGFLVPVRDEAGLADRVLYCLNNPEAVQEMTARAKKQVRIKFSLEMMIDNYEAVYRKCLGKKGRVDG
jgi:glycosyltransferase involved in cell wall biosynthesis